MRIGLYSNPEKDPQYKIACQTAAYLRQAGVQTVVSAAYAETPLAGYVDQVRESYADCDVLISLGGDGTFLSAVHLEGSTAIPILGINLGSVGFLPEVMPDDLKSAMEALTSGRYRIHQRMLLDVLCCGPDGQTLETGFALNDAVVSRGGHSRILMLDLLIDDELVERIPGDGLIVATPTGSTAYSLSASGPIVHPAMNLIMMTPICPHTLHNRSYIAPPDSTVSVRIGPYPQDAVLAIDGRQEILLASGSSVRIRKAEQALNMIRLGDDRFYAMLPRKIQARGSVI